MLFVVRVVVAFGSRCLDCSNSMANGQWLKNVGGVSLLSFFLIVSLYAKYLELVG